VDPVTDADIGRRRRVLDPLEPDPFERTVRAVVHMDDQLMFIDGMPAQAVDAQLQVREVIPGGNDDRKHLNPFRWPGHRAKMSAALVMRAAWSVKDIH